jgi:hypothetical protein
MSEMLKLAEELREYTAMKYAGDCKCGKCQLVPRALVERIYHTLNSSSVRCSAVSAERNKSHVMCIGWPTIKRLMRGESVWFEELGCGAVAASDLLQASAERDGFDKEDFADDGAYLARFSTIPAEPQSAPKLEALESCKGEQLKFEEWAAAEKYDMHEHPLHYLFMDDKTNAARQGWKAALRYAATVIAGAQCQAVSAK